MATVSIVGFSGPGRSAIGRWWREAAPRGRFWSLVPAVLLFNLGVAIFFFLYNLFMAELGYRERPLGVLAGALAFGSMAGTLPIGFAAQRFGPRRVLVACLLAVSAAFAARLFLLWYPSQVVFAFFDGVMLCGWAVCLPPTVAAIVDVPRRPTAFSLLFAMAVAAGSLGGFLGGNMPEWFSRLALRHSTAGISSIHSKRATLLVACCLTALAAWPVARIGGEQRFSPAHSWNPLRRLPPFLLRFLAASACWAAAVGAFNPFTNLFFVHYVGLATARLGNFFAVSQLIQAGAVLLVPFFLRRAGLVPGIVVFQVGTAVAAALLAAGRGIFVEECLYCTFMAAQHMCDPALQSLLMDRMPEGRRSAASSLNFLAISVAQAASATISGAAIQRFGYSAVLAAIAGGVLVAAAGFRLLVGFQPAAQRSRAFPVPAAAPSIESSIVTPDPSRPRGPDPFSG